MNSLNEKERKKKCGIVHLDDDDGDDVGNNDGDRVPE